MLITKRSGQTEEYDRKKIALAITKAFKSTGIEQPDDLDELLDLVEKQILVTPGCSVETIQDRVEEALMQRGHYQVAKNFILYREKRTELRTCRLALSVATGDSDLDGCLFEIQNDFKAPEYSLEVLTAKFNSQVSPTASVDEKLDTLIRSAVELTTQNAPRYEQIAGRLLCHSFKRKLAQREQNLGLTDFYTKLMFLTEHGLYGKYILENYTKEEIDEAAGLIDENRNKLFNYSGLQLVLERYVIKNHNNEILESPQELFLGVALHLAMPEKKDVRMQYVKRFYDMLSKLEVTMATPTLANARKPYHQLSSCFIDTVPDSLAGIYRSLDNFAQVSKFGGGMGLYFGKVRARGSDIRGFKGAAGGVSRWIKLVNDTAVAVDQLGVRQGAVAVYLDIWHRDIPEFLQMRTNNGDDRLKAHDTFPALCVPDYFWQQVRDNFNGVWYLMCPHEISQVRGYNLEDSFGEEWTKRYLECVHDNRITKREISLKDLVRLFLKSVVETGTPFIFNRDLVNAMNPNAHCGHIYSSNLCTEIAQNTAPIQSVSREIKTSEGTVEVVTTTKPGDFVVCNLASLNLGRIPVDEPGYLEHLTSSVVRALDNVIDLNFYPTPYAEITSKRYRAIGLGVSGYHHMLAKHGIRWESEEHLAFVDKVFERIAHSAIETSALNAKDKGTYGMYKGSDWDTGAFFEKRGYNTPYWDDVKADVAKYGMRNGYLMAIAPTGSTSIIAGTTPGIDPIMNRYFLEEKKNGLLPRVAPDLSSDTWWLYKNAHLIDQNWSIRACGVRQRHIDQAQSINLYITNDFTMRKVLNLYLEAWKCGVKTIYYIRSKSLEVEECESCSS